MTDEKRKELRDIARLVHYRIRNAAEATDAPPDMTALCQVRNVRWPRHDWHPFKSLCKRCGEPFPKLNLKPKP